MCEHYDKYKDLDTGTVNADLPSWMTYSSMQDHIASMADVSSMPGELEIAATSKVLERSIVAINTEYVIIQRYGETDFGNTQPLFILFRSVGEDVGHFDCVLHRLQLQREAGPSTENAMTSSPADDNAPHRVENLIQTPSTSCSDQQTRNLIRNLSPLPKLSSKRPRTRKAEEAAILTSSPYKSRLLIKQRSKATMKKKVWENQNKPTNKKRRKVGKSNKSRQQDMSDDEDEDWPCLICCEPYSSTRPGDVGLWVQCQLCLHWAHEECTPGQPQFVCPNCDSNDSD